jgi:transcriptional regulator with XRE-family HTH domain
MSTSDRVFGNKIKQFRSQRGWKQETLADKSGLSQSEISKVENGNVRGGKDTIEKLAEAFEVDVEVLVRNTTFASLFEQTSFFAPTMPNQALPIIAYFAGALTGLSDEHYDEITKLDEKVNEVCRNYSRYPIALYRPRTETSPRVNRQINPRNVYEIDLEHVSTSNLLILAGVFPSLGAGMELQIALQSCSVIILLIKKGQELSKMVRGCPAILKIVEYEDLTDLEIKLVEAIDMLLPIIAALRASNTQLQDSSEDFELGNRIKQIREQLRYSPETLAGMVGIDTPYIEFLESKSERVSNPSLQIIRQIAKALLTTEAFLICGQHSQDIRLTEHSDSLKAFARKNEIPFSECEEMWLDHQERYKNDFQPISVDNREEIDEKYWTKLHDRLKKQKTNGRLFD